MDYRRLLDLTGQVALVVGAASGIGRASAEALAAFGAKVALADRDAAGLSEVAEGLRRNGLEADALPVDIAEREAADRLVAWTTEPMADWTPWFPPRPSTCASPFWTTPTRRWTGWWT